MLSGVQDMACDTYMKITTTCGRQFVVRQSDEKEPFVDEILRMINRITVDLFPQQVCIIGISFYYFSLLTVVIGTHIL